MPRYVAFLRGVSPTNLKMSDLKRALESAGFTGVATLLSSGNVAFDTQVRSVAAIERTIEAALRSKTARDFYTIVRLEASLLELVETNPFSSFGLEKDAKRFVVLSRNLLSPKQKLPIEKDGAQILVAHDREAFGAYVPSPKGPVFMELIKQCFGSEVTTRTWDTISRCSKA